MTQNDTISLSIGMILVSDQNLRRLFSNIFNHKLCEI